MSKIMCDICGTVYQDTAEVCPICGYPRENSKTVVDDDPITGTAAPAAAGSAARVKGGRYSNKNVKKRHQTETVSTGRREPAAPKEPEKASRGQIIAVILLSVAIVLVSLYIGWRFYKGRNAYDNPETNEPSSTTVPTETQEPTEQSGGPCQDLVLSSNSVVFTESGETWQLEVTTNPAQPDEELVFSSSDSQVAGVTADGLVVAMGPGNAIITVSCGEVSREFIVTCLFLDEPTEPVETTEPEPTQTEAPTEPEETQKPTEATKPNNEGLNLSHKDVTLFKEGESFRIVIKYNGETVSAAAATFSSKDETVATVEANGKVTAVGAGVTTITVYYNGESVKCIVRCNIETEETEETEPTQPTEAPEETEKPEETEEPTEEAAPSWQISNTDVTLRVGEKFRLRITNSAGETADVAWSVNKDGVVSVDGNTVTGLTDGRVTLTATVDGQTFSCIVRVKS